MPKTTRDFAKMILEAENFNDWTVRFSAGGSICLVKSKEILLDSCHEVILDWRSKLAVVHEIAHIRTIDKDKKHSGHFMTEYANLIMKYLCKEIGGGGE